MACGARRNFSDDFIYSSHPTNGEIRSPVDGIYSAKLGTDHRCLFLLFKFLFLRILPPFTYLKSVGYRVFFFSFISFISNLSCLILCNPCVFWLFWLDCTTETCLPWGSLWDAWGKLWEKAEAQCWKKCLLQRCLWPFIRGEYYVINAWNMENTCNIPKRFTVLKTYD